MDKMIEEAAATLTAAAHDAGDRRSENALNKALFHYLSGVRPLPTTGGWLIPSGTRPGVIHRVSTDHGCNCEAAAQQQACWHASLVEILSAAHDQADRQIAYEQAVNDLMECFV
jgi:hypothetical protein